MYPMPTTKKRKTRGKYEVYSPKNRAEIGRYALENGNNRARFRFLSSFPNLDESTIMNFKKAYKEGRESSNILVLSQNYLLSL